MANENAGMTGIVFRLNSIPDLTLTKYASLGGRGTKAALAAHDGFLRQFSRKPGTSLHLLYAYNPDSADGERLHIYVLVCQTDAGIDALNNARELVEASPLAPYFKDLTAMVYNPENGGSWKPSKHGEDADASQPMERIAQFLAAPSELGDSNPYTVCAMLTKSTELIKLEHMTNSDPNGYYVQHGFEQNDDSRLFSLMKLMEALDKPVVYRVDLFPETMTDLRRRMPLNQIRQCRTSSGPFRDYELEGIEKSFEKLLEKLVASPLFNANISVFSTDRETGRSLLAAAASEALELGDCDTIFFEGRFAPLSFLTGNCWAGALRGEDAMGRPYQAVQRRITDRMTGFAFQIPGYYLFEERTRSIPYAFINTEFTLEEASSFFRLPVLEEGESVQRKKETAPDPYDPRTAKGKSLYLGKDRNGQKVYFREKLMTKHAFISGVPGSGKTVTMLHLVTSLFRDKVPFLVLEPAKAEYRAVLNDPELGAQVRLFAPGGTSAFPLRLNPFEMPIGVSVGHHINRLCQVFEGSFPLEGALPFIIDRSIESVYSKKGWNAKMVRTGKEGLEFPTLQELYDQVQVELENESYGGEVGGNLKAATHMRIGGLLRRELGDIFNVPRSTVDPSDWLKMSAIVELEALGATQSNFLTLLLCVLVREGLMANPVYDGDLRHVLFIEEAHNLIGPEVEALTGEGADPKRTATQFISDMLREVRALKEGIVIADQLPTAIAPEVLKNTGLKIALRITSSDDRQLIGSMMAASPVQLEGMAVANPGEALVMYEGLQKPFTVAMSNWLHDKEMPQYIEDEEEYERRKTSRRNDELRAFLQDEVRAQWHFELARKTLSIDLEAVERHVETLEKAWSNAMKAVLAFDEANPLEAAVSSSVEFDPFAAVAAEMDSGDRKVRRSEVLQKAIIAEGYKQFSAFRDEATACPSELDMKLLNCASIIKAYEAFGGGLGQMVKWANSFEPGRLPQWIVEDELKCVTLRARIAKLTSDIEDFYRVDSLVEAGERQPDKRLQQWFALVEMIKVGHLKPMEKTNNN